MPTPGKCHGQEHEHYDKGGEEKWQGTQGKKIC